VFMKVEPKKFYKGQLLLDSGQLRGSFFQRTVVLICHHDAEGAFGLVLNRGAGATVGESIATEVPEALRDQPLYLGGPVQPSAMSFLYTSHFMPEANILPDLSVGHSLEALVEIGDSFSPTKRIRLFSGYAGWSPGQLEEEMKRQAWLTHPGSVDAVFDPDPTQLWQKILRQKDWRCRLLAQSPEDPSVN